MSHAIQTEVWRHSQHGGAELLLLLALADNADEVSRKCWPGVTYLAAKTRLSERTVQRLLRKLDGDEIEIIRRPGKSNYYRLLSYGDSLSPLPPNDPRHSSVTPNGDTALSPEPKVEPSLPPGAALALAHAGTLTAHFVDEYRAAAGQAPPKRTVKQLAAEAKRLLDEGADSGTVQTAISLMIEKRLAPSTLPSLMLEAAAGPRRTRRFGRGVTSDEMLIKARNTKRMEDLDEALRSRNGANAAARGLPSGSH